MLHKDSSFQTVPESSECFGFATPNWKNNKKQGERKKWGIILLIKHAFIFI